MLGDVLDGAVSGGPIDDKSPAAQRDRLRQLYDIGSDAMTAKYGPGSGSLSTRLGTIMATATTAIRNALENASLSALLELSLGVEVLSGMLAWGSEDYDVPEFRFHNVTPGAEAPPGIPLGSLANLPSWPLKKLYGQRLGHFGAFASEEGRKDDWLWGRLDGASELSKQLLASAGVDKNKAAGLRAALIAEILQNEGLSADDVVQKARKVYKLPATKLIKDMAAKDGGRSLIKLEDTLWQLSNQLDEAGFWLRLVLAPDWSRDELRGRKLTDRMWMPALRVGCGIVRQKLRNKLPEELSMSSRRRLRAKERKEARGAQGQPQPSVQSSIGASAGRPTDIGLGEEQ
jgi:hypothetical protein